MARIEVIVTPQGISYLSSPAAGKFLPTETKQVSRISHVTPTNFVLRVVFNSLRLVFGDYGRVAAFTRRWKCLWQVDFGPIGGEVVRTDMQGRPFSSHAQAVTFELPFAVEILQKEIVKHAGAKPTSR